MNKKVILFLLNLLSIQFSFGRDVCLNEVKNDYEVKDFYEAKGIKGQKHKLSYSYEIEYNLRENPNIVNYYKVKGYSDEAWMKLSKQERLKIALDKHRNTASQNKTVLVKTDTAPEFLPKKMVKESNVNLEMIDNPISENLDEIYKNLDWIWENLGPGSVQGHVAFGKKGVRLNSVDQYIKLDYDLSQAQAFSKGYSSYLKNGKRGSPGANITHHSLGPVDNITLKKVRKATNPKKDLKGGVSYDRNMKFVYGTAYRKDLYGRSKVGFEIRNCHKRLDCIKSKMKNLSEDVENNFDFYKHIEPSQEISKDLMKSLPEDIQAIYMNAGKIQGNKYSGYVTGSSYDLRYLNPHLDWVNHPYIKALPETKKKEFIELLEKVNAEHLKEVRRIGVYKNGTLPERLQIANAKWGYDLKLDEYLAEGKEILQKIHKQDFIESEGLNLVRAKDADAEAYKNINEAIRKIAMTAGNADEGRKIARGLKNIPQSKLAKNLKEIDNSKKARHVVILSENVKPEIVGSLFRQSDNKIKFLENYSQLPKDRQVKLGKVLNETGLSTTIETPHGSWVHSKLAENNVESLNKLMDITDEMGLTTYELSNVLTASSIKKFPKDFFDNPVQARHVLDILSKRKSPESVVWMQENLGKIKIKSKKDRSFYHTLMLDAADDLKAISKNEFLGKIGDKEYVIKVRKSNQPLSVKTLDEFGTKKAQKMYEKKLASFSKGKVKVSREELINVIRKNPDQVYVISATGIHHQGLVIGDTVYSVVSNSGISKLPVENWVSNWGNSTLVELNLNKVMRKKVFDSIEDEVGKPVKFAIKAKKGHINCTNMVSCHLEGPGAMKFPNDYVRADSKGQIKYLSSLLGREDLVKAVYVRKMYAVDPQTVMKWTVYGMLGISSSLVGYVVYDILKED